MLFPTALSVLSLVLATGCASVPRAPVTAAAPEPAHVYRLDFVIASTDAGGAPSRSTYTINLEDQDRSGELHVGANVSLAPNGSHRQDVGVKIRCGLVAQGTDLVVRGDTEISASAGDSSIHKIHVRGVSLVKPGTPALIASLDEPATHAHYDVSVTATRLN